MLNDLPYNTEEKDLIVEALKRLAADNPKLPEQLVKLADVKENKPGMWKRALVILKF